MTQMRRSRRILAAVFILGYACGAWARPVHTAHRRRAASGVISAEDRGTLAEFDKKIVAYAKLRQKLPRDTHLKPTTQVADLEARRKAMKDSIRALRPEAKQGDFFTPEIGKVFRKLLANTLSGPAGPKIRTSLQHAEPGTAAKVPDIAVKEDFPEKTGTPLQSSPPSLLVNLPPLPKGIEYRVVGKTLVLRDAEANLVIDYLPDALV